MKKQKSAFQKTIERSAVIFGLVSAGLFVLHYFVSMDIFEILAITAFTFFYHFAMRLAIGYIVPKAAAGVDPSGRWFEQKPFEKKLYKLIRVKDWKDRMPTYSPEDFSLEKHTPEEIIRSTCTSELVHEVIVPFSFVPLLFSLVWGTFGVFLATSLAAAAFDLCFVIMQRYNRPRLARLLKRVQTKKNVSGD